MADDGSLDGYVRFDFTDPLGRWTRPVFRRGAGPVAGQGLDLKELSWDRSPFRQRFRSFDGQHFGV